MKRLSNTQTNLPPGTLLRDIDPTDPSTIEDFLDAANQREQWRLAAAEEKADIEREDSVRDT